MAKINQAFILSYIYESLEERFKNINWSGIKVKINPSTVSSNDVGIDIKVLDVLSNIYENINDQIRVEGKLIPRSLNVISSYAIFIYSENQKEQLKAAGLLLQDLRANRKIDIGEYNWLNNNGSPVTIDTVNNTIENHKGSVKRIWNKETSLVILFNINSSIDSQIAVDFVEVKQRQLNMEKINAK